MKTWVASRRLEKRELFQARRPSTIKRNRYSGVMKEQKGKVLHISQCNTIWSVLLAKMLGRPMTSMAKAMDVKMEEGEDY
jgi:hypothetical protein